jgi:hypothetical protein
VVAVLGLVATGVRGSSAAPPVGALVDLGGEGGCVALADDYVGHPQNLPVADHCAAGWVFQQLHHVTLSRDERFVCTPFPACPGHPKGDESALGIFSRSANTGAVEQLSGRARVERQDPPRDLGCATARNLLGLRFVTVWPDDRFLYTTGGAGDSAR